MIDTVLANRYRIQAKVGEGGMAVVYRAMDVVLRRVVAIKVLRSQYAGDRSSSTGFGGRRKPRPACRIPTWSTFSTSAKTTTCITSCWSTCRGTI